MLKINIYIQQKQCEINIWRGFFGPRAAPPPLVVLKEVLPVRKGKDPIPEVGSCSVAAVLPSSQVSSSSNGAAVKETRRESGTPTNSSVSLSQLWYTRRMKEKVAKQLNKNKDLIAEVVGVIPVVGEDRVANALNLEFWDCLGEVKKRNFRILSKLLFLRLRG
jgi:hypothetical protein